VEIYDYMDDESDVEKWLGWNENDKFKLNKSVRKIKIEMNVKGFKIKKNE
jgi:hypothetical protein